MERCLSGVFVSRKKERGEEKVGVEPEWKEKESKRNRIRED